MTTVITALVAGIGGPVFFIVSALSILRRQRRMIDVEIEVADVWITSDGDNRPIYQHAYRVTSGPYRSAIYISLELSIKPHQIGKALKGKFDPSTGEIVRQWSYGFSRFWATSSLVIAPLLLLMLFSAFFTVEWEALKSALHQ